MDNTLVRHFLLLEPFFLFISAFFIYIIYLFISKKIINYYYKISIFIFLILPFLFQPFIYKEYIVKQYSTQKEYLFINNNINKLWKKFNLIIPNSEINRVAYVFPKHLLFKIENYDIYLYNISDHIRNRYDSFVYSYNDTISNKNIFYLSTACYSFGDLQSNFIKENNIREDCYYIKNNFILKPIVEYKMKKETYIIPVLTTPLNEITIWFYEIIWKK